MGSTKQPRVVLCPHKDATALKRGMCFRCYNAWHYKQRKQLHGSICDVCLVPIHPRSMRCRKHAERHRRLDKRA